jgi:hypothetical protein
MHCTKSGCENRAHRPVLSLAAAVTPFRKAPPHGTQTKKPEAIPAMKLRFSGARHLAPDF